MALFDIFGGGNPTTDFTDAPSEADRKRALNMALMQAGAAILANNRGNYGALAPALGAGIQNGLLSYNYNYEKGQQAAAKRKQMEMQKKLFSESMIPASLGSAGTPATSAQYKVGDMPFSSPQEAEQYITKQGGGGTRNMFQNDFSQLPQQTPLYLDPKMQVNAIPGTPGSPAVAPSPGGFNTQKFLMGALQNPEAGFANEALGALLKAPENVKPELVTVYEDGKPVQKWVRPGEATGTVVGQGKPEASPDKTALLQMMAEGGIDPKSPDGQRIIRSWLTKQSTHAPGTNVSVGGANIIQEKAEAKGVGEANAKQYTDIQNAGFKANSNVTKYARLSNLLSGVQTGKLTPIGTEVAAWAQSAGFDVDPKLGNKQAAESLSNAMALELRSPSGGAGMPGALSDQDRQFLLKMVPSLATSPEGRKMMLETATALSKRDQEVAKMARSYRKKYGSFDADFYDELQAYADAHPLFKNQGSTDVRSRADAIIGK